MMDRRTLLKYGVAGVAAPALEALPARAQSAEFTFKWAQNIPPTHPLNIRSVEAWAVLEKYSGTLS
jgi:hypothetical protein